MQGVVLYIHLVCMLEQNTYKGYDLLALLLGIYVTEN